jgi:hypothetical protein
MRTILLTPSRMEILSTSVNRLDLQENSVAAYLHALSQFRRLAFSRLVQQSIVNRYNAATQIERECRLTVRLVRYGAENTPIIR